MEKSIEGIWKSGFLSADALVAPEVNDLYNAKSEHVIERFDSMFRVNLKMVAIGAFFALPGFWALGMPIVGLVLVLTLTVVYFVNRRELQLLVKIDKNESCYEYLKAFEGWLKSQVELNQKMARFYYPFIFLGTVLGVWLSEHGKRIFSSLGGTSEGAWLLNGIPLVYLLPFLALAGLFACFGGRLYQMELNALYGRVIAKLDEILEDIETLRSEA